MAKTEQAGFIEKNVEKLLLALAAVALLVVMSKWVFHSPYSLQSSSGSAISADEIPADRLRIAELAKTEIENRKVLLSKLAPYTQIITSTMLDSVAEKLPPCPPLTSASILPEVAPGIKPNTGAIAAMGPLPPLKSIQARISQETIHRPPVQSATGTGMDLVEDVFAAHVTGLLDYAALVRPWVPLQKERGVDITVLFLEVTAERQELLPDGSWSPSVPIAGERPASMRVYGGTPVDFDIDPARLVDPMARQQYVDQLKMSYGAGGAQQDVLEPEYYPVYWSEVQNWGTWKHHLPRTELSSLPDIQLDPNDLPPQAGQLASPPNNQAVGRAGTMGGEGMGEQGRMPVRPMAGREGGMMGGEGGRMGGEGGRMGGEGGRGVPARTPVNPAVTQQDRNQTMALAGVEKGRKKLDVGDYDEAIKEANTALRLVPGMPEAVALLGEAQELKRQATLPSVTKVPPLMAQCKAGAIQVWLHDTTCQQGKTYRYRLMVKMLNPLFGQGGSLPLANPADAESPTLTLASDWSSSAMALPEMEFFLAGGSKENQDVQFEIYRQRLGQWLVQRSPVKCGDPVAAPETRKLFDLTQQNVVVEKDVDFATGHLLVDCDFERPSSGGLADTTVVVTLLGPDGQLTTRDLAADKRSLLHRDLAERAKQADEWIKAAGLGRSIGGGAAPVYTPRGFMGGGAGGGRDMN